jgi:hypothetical protein
MQIFPERHCTSKDRISKLGEPRAKLQSRGNRRKKSGKACQLHVSRACAWHIKSMKLIKCIIKINSMS